MIDLRIVVRESRGRQHRADDDVPLSKQLPPSIRDGYARVVLPRPLLYDVRCMPRYVAMLRAVNVGGTGKLPMATLVRICEALGFDRVRTYIASGNAMFSTRMREQKVKAILEQTLADYADKPIGVLVRTDEEMAAVLATNPFRTEPPERTVAIFLDQAPPAGALEEVRGRRTELLALGAREIYVAYKDGIAHSKLGIPAATSGTARNMNTVAKLAAMAAET